MDEVLSLRIVGEHLAVAETADLAALSNLAELVLDENQLSLNDLTPIPSVRALSIACNQMSTVKSLCDQFVSLEASSRFIMFILLLTLDLSFNALDSGCLYHLATLPSLKVLNLMANDISSVPKEIFYHPSRILQFEPSSRPSTYLLYSCNSL